MCVKARLRLNGKREREKGGDGERIRGGEEGRRGEVAL